MSKHLLMFCMAATALLFVACQPPAPAAQPEADPAEVRATIQSMENDYAKALNEKNAEAILAYYADNARRLPPDEPMIQGKDAIRKEVQENMASDTSGGSVKFNVIEVWTAGNLAVEIGSSEFTTADGTVENGKYMAVFEMRDSTWVCVADIWNEDADDDEDEAGDDDN